MFVVESGIAQFSITGGKEDTVCISWPGRKVLAQPAIPRLEKAGKQAPIRASALRAFGKIVKQRLLASMLFFDYRT